MPNDLPGQIIGYRKNGLPIRLLAGGAPEEENPTPNAPAAPGTSRFYTEEDYKAAIEAARQQEKDKLYGRISKDDERSKALDAELKELRAFQRKQEKAEETRLAQIEAERKKAEEAELSAKDLIEKVRQESAAQLAQAQQDQQQQLTLMARELEYSKLQAYIQRRVNEEADNLAPELLDFIDGETVEQVEASIEMVKAKTAQLVESFKSARAGQRASMPGVAPSSGTNGVTPLDQPGDRQYSDEDIKNMTNAEYRAFRKVVGMDRVHASNTGIFGM
jgi:vacuolar-type H+-ATPase subunit I/STV1